MPYSPLRLIPDPSAVFPPSLRRSPTVLAAVPWIRPGQRPFARCSGSGPYRRPDKGGLTTGSLSM